MARKSIEDYRDEVKDLKQQIHDPEDENATFSEKLDNVAQALERRRLPEGAAISRLLDFTAAVHELLLRTPRRAVNLLRGVFNPESPPKLSVERIGVIAHHVQSTALLGTLRPEGAHDNVTTWPDSIDDGLNILAAFGGIDEEMEDCAIVPHVERLEWQGDLSDISNQPAYAARDPIQTLLRHFYRRARHIEDRKPLVAEGQKIIHQR
jgi:hypothetical protein